METDLEKITFDLMNFVYNLKYMGIGMLGVFMIIAIIVCATYLIAKFSESPSEE